MKFLASKNTKAFTITEILIVIGILIVLFSMTVPVFRYFRQRSDLDNSAEEIINTLRLAQNKTLSSEQASQYGVFFDTLTVPHQYILFKGVDFSSRDVNFDENHNLPAAVEIYQIDLEENSEVVFERLSGVVNQPGSIGIRLIDDFSETKTIYINGSGQIGLVPLSVPSDINRVKDSRHIHIDYGRIVSISTEKIILTFTFNGSTVVQEIVVADNIQEGQIYWQGEVNVNGELQKLKIHTHHLNNPDTEFSIHRDRRYNTKALTITLNEDASGSLIEYSANGLNTSSTSGYVTNLQWQ